MGKDKTKSKSQSEIESIAEYFDDVTSLQIVLAIHPSGVTVSKCFYNSGEGIQENLVSAALSVITTFESEISDQMGMTIDESKGKIHTVDYKNFTITVLDGKNLRLSIISSKPLGNKMKKKCKSLLNLYEMAHSSELKNFTGETNFYDDFPEVVDKELDGNLNKRCFLNILSLDSYDGPKKLKSVLYNMHKMNEEIIPARLPPIFIREATISETNAKFYAYDTYKCYVIEPIGKSKNL